MGQQKRIVFEIFLQSTHISTPNTLYSATVQLACRSVDNYCNLLVSAVRILCTPGNHYFAGHAQSMLCRSVGSFCNLPVSVVHILCTFSVVAVVPHNLVVALHILAVAAYNLLLLLRLSDHQISCRQLEE